MVHRRPPTSEGRGPAVGNGDDHRRSMDGMVAMVMVMVWGVSPHTPQAMVQCQGGYPPGPPIASTVPRIPPHIPPQKGVQKGGQNGPFLGGPGDPPPRGGPGAPPGGAPGGQKSGFLTKIQIRPLKKMYRNSVPTGRIIKYPKKCALFCPPGPPGGPPGPPPGPPLKGGPRGGLRGGPRRVPRGRGAGG